ncbi:MAG: hypothetical protein ACJ79A_04895 [Gemmatimonadaceae bacterium]
MTVRTRLLIAMVIAPVLWGVACHDGDGPTSPDIPPEVQALKTSLAPYSSLALAKNAGYAVALTDCMSNGDVFGVWALHVWTHRANPSGLFASWNARALLNAHRWHHGSLHLQRIQPCNAT